MHKINLSQDIQPLSEFRSKIGTFIERINKTKRPIVITHHGKSAAVVLNVDSYVALVDHFEMLEDIKRAKEDIKHGRVMNSAALKKRLLKAIRK